MTSRKRAPATDRGRVANAYRVESPAPVYNPRPAPPVQTVEEREYAAGLNRCADRLRSFLHGYGEAYALHRTPDREAILALLDPYDHIRALHRPVPNETRFSGVYNCCSCTPGMLYEQCATAAALDHLDWANEPTPVGTEEELS